MLNGTYSLIPSLWIAYDPLFKPKSATVYVPSAGLNLFREFNGPHFAVVLSDFEEAKMSLKNPWYISRLESFIGSVRKGVSYVQALRINQLFYKYKK